MFICTINNNANNATMPMPHIFTYLYFNECDKRLMVKFFVDEKGACGVAADQILKKANV